VSAEGGFTGGARSSHRENAPRFQVPIEPPPPAKDLWQEDEI
jgi:hypothetical protein